MTCAEFKELVGAYAIGALDPAEKAAMDAHLASTPSHEGCIEALREANDAAALVAMSIPAVQPSRALWESLEAKLDKQVQAAPAPKQTSWLPWLAVAAMLVLVVLVGLDRMRLAAQVQTLASDEQRATQLATNERTQHALCVADLDKAKADVAMQAKALQLLERTGVRLVAMAPQADSKQVANVIFSPTTQEAYVVGHGLAAAADKDFELWLIRGDQKIAAGLLKGRVDANGALIAQIDPKLLGTTPPDAFAVTLEPKGGSEQPRGTIVLVGKI